MKTTIELTTYMQNLLQRCIEEDGGGCDVTTESIISPQINGSFAFHIRGPGILAGLTPLKDAIDVFEDLSIVALRRDGDEVKDEKVALVEGPISAILGAERILLNILGHASGIATRTKMFVDAVAQCSCDICDTRKTTPGLRLLDKYAVVCGGGTSHRSGLHDAALFKDNHLSELKDFSTELEKAISRLRVENKVKFIEVEVDTIEQLEKVLLLQVDIILLDNMPMDVLREAVAIRNASDSSPKLEASGGVTLETVREIAETGVDRISIGGLTHQATWIDFGLDAIDA